MTARTGASARMRHATSKRLGFAGYCRILSGIISKPGTGAELAQRFGVCPNGMAYVLRSMHRMNLIHRADWVRPKAHSVLVPVWHGGKGADVVPIVAAKRYTSRTARTSAITLGSIAEALEHGPLPMLELSQDVGLHRETMIRLVRIMRDHGLMRIAAWEPREKGGGPAVPMYAFGRGKDKSKPAPIARTPERAQLYAERHAAKRRHLAMLQATAGNRKAA